MLYADSASYIDAYFQVRQDDFSDLADVRALGAGAPPANAPQVPSSASPSHTNTTAPARTTDKKLV